MCIVLFAFMRCKKIIREPWSSNYYFQVNSYPTSCFRWWVSYKVSYKVLDLVRQMGSELWWFYIVVSLFSTFVPSTFQVETVAQFGVVFLLFGLGLEFSLAKVLFCLIHYHRYISFYYCFSRLPNVYYWRSLKLWVLLLF